MHNKVVFKVAQTLQTLGMPALRFNFRGVGHSTGTYDEGHGEMDDVRYALEFLGHRYTGLPVILSGFSFGAYVGLRVAAIDDRVQAMIGLGTPARLLNDEYLNESQKPKLFIHSTNDKLAPYDLLLLFATDITGLYEGYFPREQSGTAISNQRGTVTATAHLLLRSGKRQERIGGRRCADSDL